MFICTGSNRHIKKKKGRHFWEQDGIIQLNKALTQSKGTGTAVILSQYLMAINSSGSSTSAGELGLTCNSWSTVKCIWRCIWQALCMASTVASGGCWTEGNLAWYRNICSRQEKMRQKRTKGTDGRNDRHGRIGCPANIAPLAGVAAIRDIYMLIWHIAEKSQFLGENWGTGEETLIS